MDAMKDALMKRRMKMAEMDQIDPQMESIAQDQYGLMGSEEMNNEDELNDGSDLAPEIDMPQGDDYQMQMDAKAALSNQGVQNDGDATSSDELMNLEKMYDGGSDLRNKGFMGKAAMKMKDRLSMLKK